MMKTPIYFLIVCAAIGNAACSGGATPSNSNSNQPANLPPEFSTKPITPTNGATPGIPPVNQANLSNAPAGATPTPGIPGDAERNKQFKPGATPTPGIPTEEELKRQMSRPVDPNEVNRPVSPNQKFNDGQPPMNKPVRKP